MNSGVFEDVDVSLSFPQAPLPSICTNMSPKSVVFKKICKDKSVSEAPELK